MALIFITVCQQVMHISVNMSRNTTMDLLSLLRNTICTRKIVIFGVILKKI